MELVSVRPRQTSVRSPKAIGRKRSLIADKCATLAPLMTHHAMPTEPRSLEATGVRASRRETALWAK